MGGPPPGARISDDGKWWWDGARWVPMPQGQLAVPGATVPPGPAVPPAMGVPMAGYAAPRTNSLAVASLIAGIAAWVVCPLLGAVLAIIFGHIARGQIKTSGEAGGGLALAGLILGYAHLALGVLGFILVILFFGGMAAILGIISALPTPTPTP